MNRFWTCILPEMNRRWRKRPEIRWLLLHPRQFHLHSDQDAEETVSDTNLRAWNTIPPKRPGIFKMFLAKITRNLAFSRWRSMNAEKRGGGEMTLVLEELDDCIAAPGCVGDGMDAKELAKAIRAFLNTLPAREQDIFLRRYFFVEKAA